MVRFWRAVCRIGCAIFLATSLATGTAHADDLSALDETELKTQLAASAGIDRLPILAELLRRNRDEPLSDALEIAAAAEALQDLHPDTALRADVLSLLSWLYSRRGDAELGLERALQALMLADSIDDEPLVASAHYMAAVAHYYQSQHADALDSASAALRGFDAVGSRSDAAASHALLGAIHQSRSDFSAALEHQVAALDLARELDDRRGIARAENNIGLLHWKLGQLDEARTRITTAVNLWRASGADAALASGLNNLGLIMIELGDAGGAVEYLQEGLALDAVASAPRLHGRLYSNLGYAHESLGDDAEALKFHEQALALRESAGDRWGVSLSMGQIAQIHERAGELGLAESYYLDSLDAAEAGDARHEQAQIHAALANIYEAQGRAAEALASLRQYQALSEAVDMDVAAEQIRELETARRIAETELVLSQQTQRQQRLAIAAIFLVIVAGGLYSYAQSRARLLRKVEISNDELQRTARELSESEQRYRGLFDDTSLPKLLVDLEAERVVDANGPAAAICGAATADLTDRPLSKLEPDWLRRAVSNGSDVRDSAVCVHESWCVPMEDLRYADVWIAPVPLGGRRCALVTVHDTTSVRREEEARIRTGKLESLGVLAGGIAHDFNNALGAVLGYVTLARTQLEERSGIAHLLTAAEKSLDHCAKLTSNLQTFAKGGAPRRELHDIRLRISEAVRLATSGASVMVVLEVDEGLWSAEVDLGQFKQMVSNLVINGIQAMDDSGALKVSASNFKASEPLSPSVGPGDYIRIDIRDDGCGIAADVQDRVMDPYFSTKPGGTGLGLAAAFAIASRHDGWLSFTSAVGQGSTFSVFLPARPAAAQFESGRNTHAVPGSESILVMDDDAAMQEMYRSSLTNLGYDVVITDSGEAALAEYTEALANGERFDAVIMDLTVPGGMGGKEAIAAIRQLDKDVRAIVASGYSNDPVMSEFERAGFVAALHKPFSLETMASVLRDVLKSGVRLVSVKPTGGEDLA
ncbi:MAG: tetratricopeptide repeat protein [Woeseiaceae bacterium]|nr:tetratricopeptide repeat protein [Woeseiaceae bacterium]